MEWEVKKDCFDGAQQAADNTLRNGGTQEQADERFADYFEVCSEEEPIVISNK